MKRTALVIAALLVPAAAAAQAPVHYVATPATAPAKTSVITRSTLWRARGPVYVASRAPDRTAVLCRLLAKEAGPLAGFSVEGTPIDADALAQCNAKVAAAPQAVAAK
jgi:hypothetical protein